MTTEFERRMTSLNRKQQLEFLARCTAIFADITRPSETVLRILDETREEVRFLPPGFVGLAQVHVTMSEHHRLDRGQKPVEGLLGELHGAAGARLMGHFGESGYPVPGSSGHVTFEESHRVLGIQGADLLAAEASRLHETGGPHVVAGAFERVLLNGREVRT